MSDPPAKPRLVILDGHGIIFRAYFALRDRNPLMIKKTGELTGAVYGFANTLLRVIDELQPTYLAVAMDAPGPTFRHEEDANYKAHRPPIPDDLPPQIERCKEVIDAFGIPMYEMDGVEADDTLATLADQAVAQGVDTWIATLDSDLIQLVRPGLSVFMYRPYQRDTVRYDSAEKVRDRYGIEPVQMTDYKGLVGDTSDNIPGVPGVGEKGALLLLNQHATIEDALSRLDDEIPQIEATQKDRARQKKESKKKAKAEAAGASESDPPETERAAKEAEEKAIDTALRLRLRTLKALRDNREIALHSKHMATIRHDVPCTLDLDAARVHEYDRDKVVALFQELEFRSLINRLPDAAVRPGQAAPPKDEVESHYEIVRTVPDLEPWLERARAADLIGLDLETSGRDTVTCAIAGYAIAVAPGEAAYIPINHTDGSESIDAEQAAALLRPLIEDADVAKTLHNAKFDIKVLRQHGIHLRGLRHDTMLAAFVLGESAIGLKTLATERLGLTPTPIEELIGKGKQQISMTEVAVDVAGPYAAMDADSTLRLAAIFAEELEQEPQLASLYATLELPLIDVLAQMELTGVAVDPEGLHDLAGRLEGEIAAHVAGIYESVGHEFNIGSPKQLSAVLFEELGLPKTRKTTQGYTTDAQALERLAEAHPVVEQVLQYRELSKLQSTYVATLPSLIKPETGRIHTDYNQAVAATGRLSSENPNLQNIPVRTAMGREIRAAFVPRARPQDGDAEVVFLGADYSQIELRVLAHLSEDPAMIEAFRQDEDIHAATASGVYDVAPDAVEPEMRRVAKMMNFGVIYGLTAHGLSQRARLERRDAQAFIDAYFERFARVAEWIEEIKASTRERGYAETLLGRRRYIPEIRSSNFQARAAAERVAVNMPVQGTAADVMKRAMLQIDAALLEREMAARMILQVHDELIFELPAPEVDELAAVLEAGMPRAIEMVVPLKIEMKRGPNWRDMTPYALPGSAL